MDARCSALFAMFRNNGYIEFVFRNQVFLFTTFTLLSIFAQAQSACWENERNPYSKNTYTEDEWYEHTQAWNELQPEEASLWSLFWAHQTYKQELDTANTLKNDKRKHCYIGCRITQDTSLEVSNYVGWLKESEDLADCNKKTLFEMLDYQSTIEGAEHGARVKSPEECYDFCEIYKAPKNRLEI